MINIKSAAAIVCAACLLSGCAVMKTADYNGYDTELITSSQSIDETEEASSNEEEKVTDTENTSDTESKVSSDKSEKKTASRTESKRSSSNSGTSSKSSSNSSKTEITSSSSSSKEESKTESNNETVPETEENKAAEEEESSSENESDEIMSPICYSSLFYSIDDDKLLYTDTIDGTTSPASLTKLLTAAVVMNYMDPNEIVTVGTEQYLVNEGSSVCGIAIGNRLSVNDLVTGMLMSSGNDAAYTSAVVTARYVNSDDEMSDADAVESFCGLMNNMAAQIGMNDSHFTTPDGWDDAGQYTTAADLLKLAKYALGIPEIRDIVGTSEKYVVFDSGEAVNWTNTNLLINPYSAYYCEDCIGMKTGTTGSAGACLISAFDKNGKTYISVVTGCYSDTDRYDLTWELYRRYCK